MNLWMRKVILHTLKRSTAEKLLWVKPNSIGSDDANTPVNEKLCLSAKLYGNGF